MAAPAARRVKPTRRSALRVDRAACLLLAAGVAGCAREREPAPEPPPRVKQVFHLNTYEKDFGYSQAVLVDKTLYVSGTVAADDQGRLVAPGDLAGQMRAVYDNLRRTLAAWIARRVSTAPMLGITPSFAAVAGLFTASVPPPSAATQAPSM